MQRFYLNRTEDISGISGTGRVAEGVIFQDRKVALHWLGDISSVIIYDNLGDVEKIHGHDGSTTVEMVDASPTVFTHD